MRQKTQPKWPVTTKTLQSAPVSNLQPKFERTKYVNIDVTCRVCLCVTVLAIRVRVRSNEEVRFHPAYSIQTGTGPGPRPSTAASVPSWFGVTSGDTNVYEYPIIHVDRVGWTCPELPLVLVACVTTVL